MQIMWIRGLETFFRVWNDIARTFEKKVAVYPLGKYCSFLKVFLCFVLQVYLDLIQHVPYSTKCGFPLEVQSCDSYEGTRKGRVRFETRILMV